MRSPLIRTLLIAAGLVLAGLWWIGSAQPAAAAGCDGTISYGEVISCTINVAGGTQSLTFTGTAGSTVRVRVIATGGTLNPTALIRRPNATQVCSATFSDEFNCLLDSSGTHTLVIADGSGTGTGSFSTTIQDLVNPVGCTTAALGETGVTGNITSAAQLDCFTRSGTNGQRLRIRVVETSGSATLVFDVVRPDGTTVCGLNGNTEADCVLDATGAFHILVRDSGGTSTGGYRLVVEKSPAPVGCTSVAFNDNTAVNVAVAGSWECFTFSGAGSPTTRIRLISTGGTWNPLLDVLRPDGSTVCSATFVDESSCQLDANGTHTVLVRDGGGVGSGTGTGQLVIQNLDAPVGCVGAPLGETGVTGSIDAVAEMDCFNRNASAGQRLRIRVVETSGSATMVFDVMRPDGTTVCGLNGNTEADCLLDATGVHHIVVRDSGGTLTGGYRLVVEKSPAPVDCTSVAFNANTAVNVATAGSWECFTFSGAGSPTTRIRLISTGGTWNPLLDVLRPDGSTVCSATFADESSCQLDANGTHTVLIRDGGGVGSGTGTGQLVIQNLDAPVGCVTVPYGESGLTAAISTTAEMDCFNRNASAGQRLRIRVVETSGSATMVFDVVRPDGTTVCGLNGNTEADCLLDATGVHHIVVRDSGGTLTGGYRLVVEKSPAPVGCTSVAFNDNTAVNVAVAGSWECFTFSGAGSPTTRIRLISTGGTWNPLLDVLRPDGSTVCSATFADESSCQLDANGTHTVLIRDGGGVGSGTGTGQLVIQNLDAPVGCVGVPLGETGVTGSIDAVAEMDCFNRNASAGQRLRIRVVETSGSATMVFDVMRPDGTTVCGLNGNTEADCLLDATGVHHIVVRDSGGTLTGGYRLVVEKSPAPVDCTSVAFNANTAVNVAVAGSWECFTFSGAGSPTTRIRLISTGGTWNPLLDVLRPDGSTVCSATFADESSCQLDANGTHTVLIRDGGGVGSGTGTGQLVIQNLDAPVGCAAANLGETGVPGSIDAVAEMDCFTRNVTAGQRLRIRVAETSGTATMVFDVMRPDGTTLCGLNGNTEADCLIDTTGVATILVRDSGGTLTGGYRLVIQKSPSPVGCTALTIGAAATGANFSVGGEMDCFTFPGTGKPNVTIQVVQSSGTGNVLAEVLRPDGTSVCAATFADSFTCQLDNTGPHTLLVRDGGGTGAGTANYTARVTLT